MTSMGLATFLAAASRLSTRGEHADAASAADNRFTQSTRTEELATTRNDYTAPSSILCRIQYRSVRDTHLQRVTTRSPKPPSCPLRHGLQPQPWRLFPLHPPRAAPQASAPSEPSRQERATGGPTRALWLASPHGRAAAVTGPAEAVVGRMEQLCRSWGVETDGQAGTVPALR